MYQYRGVAFHYLFAFHAVRHARVYSYHQRCSYLTFGSLNVEPTFQDRAALHQASVPSHCLFNAPHRGSFNPVYHLATKVSHCIGILLLGGHGYTCTMSLFDVSASTADVIRTRSFAQTRESCTCTTCCIAAIRCLSSCLFMRTRSRSMASHHILRLPCAW